jgi:hypothetical protein
LTTTGIHLHLERAEAECLADEQARARRRDGMKRWSYWKRDYRLSRGAWVSRRYGTSMRRNLALFGGRSREWTMRALGRRDLGLGAGHKTSDDLAPSAYPVPAACRSLPPSSLKLRRASSPSRSPASIASSTFLACGSTCRVIASSTSFLSRFGSIASSSTAVGGFLAASGSVFLAGNRRRRHDRPGRAASRRASATDRRVP